MERHIVEEHRKAAVGDTGKEDKAGERNSGDSYWRTWA